MQSKHIVLLGRFICVAACVGALSLATASDPTYANAAAEARPPATKLSGLTTDSSVTLVGEGAMRTVK